MFTVDCVAVTCLLPSLPVFPLHTSQNHAESTPSPTPTPTSTPTPNPILLNGGYNLRGCVMLSLIQCKCTRDLNVLLIQVKKSSNLIVKSRIMY
jgi:hypothetical protein